jgi:hypothetical protein
MPLWFELHSAITQPLLPFGAEVGAFYWTAWTSEIFNSRRHRSDSNKL